MPSRSNAITLQGIAAADSFNWPLVESWETAIATTVDGFKSQLSEVRHHMHRNPELSGQETNTTQFLITMLQSHGIEASRGPHDVGVLADIEIGNPGPEAPTVCIRADIDALRIQDQKKDRPYCSTIPGVMHACGHDVHSTIVLAVAAVANEIKDSQQLPAARLRFLFQPAEEICQGAAWMIQHGAMRDVDAILGLHVDPERKVGTAGVKYGALTANCDEIVIEIKGEGGHAARPHHTHDPIAAAASLISTLYQAMPRSVDARQPAVLTFGKIEGGQSSNVIPDSVMVYGTLRTTDEENRQTLKSRLNDIVAGVAQVTATKINVIWVNPLRCVNNDDSLTGALEVSACRVLGSENIQIMEQPSMGGEDFAMYLDHAPGTMFRLGCAKNPEIAPKLHSPLFDVEEEVLTIGPRILLQAALLIADRLRVETA
jgi:amidohydrolase